MTRPFVNFSMERAMGIEPTFKAWEALVLPMNYARNKLSLLNESSLLNQTDDVGLIVVVQIIYVQCKLFLNLLRI